MLCHTRNSCSYSGYHIRKGHSLPRPCSLRLLTKLVLLKGSSTVCHQFIAALCQAAPISATGSHAPVAGHAVRIIMSR